MSNQEPIVAYLDKLIAEGEALLAAKFSVQTSSFTSEEAVPLDPFQRWLGNCRLLNVKLGRSMEPWRDEILEKIGNSATNVLSLVGTIRSIKDAVEGGHLVRFEDLVFAEAFSNLPEDRLPSDPRPTDA